MLAPNAVPAPVLLSTTVQLNGLPLATVCVAGSFVMPRLGQLSVVVAEAVTSVRPVTFPVAVFVKPPAVQPWLAVVVALITATRVAFCARSFGPQASVPEVIAQVAS